MKEFNRVTSAQSEVEPMFIFEVGSLNVFKIFKCWIFVPEYISYHQEGKSNKRALEIVFCGTGSSFRLVLLTDPSDLWTQWWLCHFWKRCDQFAAKLFVLDSRLKSSVGSDLSPSDTPSSQYPQQRPWVWNWWRYYLNISCHLNVNVSLSQDERLLCFMLCPTGSNHVTVEGRERCRPEQ